MEKKESQSTSYLFIAGVVAIVAIVALVLNGSESLGGAATFGKGAAETYQESCVDDDPENDFFVAGTATFGPYLYEDYCLEDQLTQYYCGTGRTVKATRQIECEKGCRAGVCLK